MQKLALPADFAPALGDILHPDGWRFPGQLVESNWEPATFRVTTEAPAIGPYTATPSGFVELAIRLEITGKELRWRKGEWWVRVRVIFPGDCEPDQTCLGWLRPKSI